MATRHLPRFLDDPAEHLTGYGVFYGNDSQPAGPPPGTGSLRRSARPWPQHSVGSTGRLLGTAQDFTSTGGQVKSTVSLQSLLKSGGRTRTADGQHLTRSLGTFTPNGTLAGTTYSFNDGSTYVSKSGLPPLVYKAGTTEYTDEYRHPVEKKDTLRSLTAHYGTEDALKTSRFQFKGYPQHYKEFSETSLTARGSTAPNYESRVVAF